MVVVCGGVIPVQDHPALAAAGVSAVFGPGTPVPTAAGRVLDAIEAKAQRREASSRS